METTSQRPVAIVQARMGSTRLPGKVMRFLVGKPVLWHVVDRLRFCKKIETIIVATTTEPEDDVIEDWCCAHGVRCFRGSQEDVLDRIITPRSFIMWRRSFASPRIVRRSIPWWLMNY